MPQLVKGGKWVFGWVIIGAQGQVRIPPEAFTEYGFQPGEEIVFLRGSRRSGGFSVGRPEKLAQAKTPLQTRALGHGMIDDTAQVVIPADAGVKPAERLLVVRGSGLALGFLQRGPIFQEALRYSEIEIFGVK